MPPLSSTSLPATIGWAAPWQMLQAHITSIILGYVLQAGFLTAVWSQLIAARLILTPISPPTRIVSSRQRLALFACEFGYASLRPLDDGCVK